MHTLPITPPGRCGVFTGREAASAGWTPDALRHAVDAGAVIRLRRGCFATAPTDDVGQFDARDLDLAQRTVAATLASRDTHGSHLGAAALFGLPLWAPDPRVCVTTRRDCGLAGVHVHQAHIRPGHFGVLGGVPVTSVERTIVDVARECGTEAALVVADAALRRGTAAFVTLAEMVETLGFDLDVAAARRVVDLADAAAESPLESRSRWHLDAHEVPAPLTQVEIFTRGGQFLGRTDFYWREGVVGEVDGSSKYDTRDVLVREKWRQERMESVDLGAVRWGAGDLRDFGPTAARIERARARAASRTADRQWVAIHPDLCID